MRTREDRTSKLRQKGELFEEKPRSEDQSKQLGRGSLRNCTFPSQWRKRKGLVKEGANGNFRARKKDRNPTFCHFRWQARGEKGVPHKTCKENGGAHKRHRRKGLPRVTELIHYQVTVHERKFGRETSPGGTQPLKHDQTGIHGACSWQRPAEKKVSFRPVLFLFVH